MLLTAILFSFQPITKEQNKHFVADFFKTSLLFNLKMAFKSQHILFYSWQIYKAL